MCTPILLKGSDLGERHNYFNSLVNTAFEQRIDLSELFQAMEVSPVDRLYKIDVASKHTHLDYILQNLKDDEILYVSRALRCHWLLEPQYHHIMNPQYLETCLFPHMIQPAVNKMKRWIRINLRDSTRCQEFYEYYRNEFHTAIMFLWHCSSDYVAKEIMNIAEKLTPQHLKIICETIPEASKVFFDSLEEKEGVLSRYLDNELDYFKSLRCLLKNDTLLYLDIIEKYFNVDKFEPLNSSATRYIMKNYKYRFNAKRELYTCYILHVNTLASYLAVDEARDLVLLLARAEYLASRFSYKKVEPILKRLCTDERTVLKKQIFVKKSLGDFVKDWPYPPPLILTKDNTDNVNIFIDNEHLPYEYEKCKLKKKLMKRKYCASLARGDYVESKSTLAQLFDKYRFKGFERTFNELNKKIAVEGTPEGRMNIFLVLISKSGGHASTVTKLLNFLIEKHINEPINVRAAVIRSLVKRGCVWRLPDDIWNLFIKFGYDLGLDGQATELICREGLHAVVLRHLIADIPMPPILLTAFLNETSTLKEYKLKSEERTIVLKGLGNLLLYKKPHAFLDMSSDYRLKVNEFPDAEAVLLQRARKDSELMHRLFNSKIGRRHLLRESFLFTQNNESYMNALRHDVTALEQGKRFTKQMTEGRPCHVRFLQSLAIYFSEPDGLADMHRASLIDALKQKPHPRFASPINILSKNDSLPLYLNRLNEMELEGSSKLKLATALKVSAHKCIPTIDIKNVDWKWIGVQPIANKAFICRTKDQEYYIKRLLQWKRTAQIAIRIGISSPHTFIAASKLIPSMALKIAITTHLKNSIIDPLVWNEIKLLIENLDITKVKGPTLDQLNVVNISKSIQSEYWVVIYKLFIKISKRRAMPILCRLENLLPSVDCNVIRTIIDQFINEELTRDRFIAEDDINKCDCYLYLRIIAKYLLACTDESDQNERLQNVLDVFFDKAEALYSLLEYKEKRNLKDCLYEFVRAMKYNKVFLNRSYVSSLPVFKRVLARVKRILLVEMYFGIYVEMHLLMLYYRSLKRAMEQKQIVFQNFEQNMDEAIQAVGLDYGRNIGREIKELTHYYYFSIIDIYNNEMANFLFNNFGHNYHGGKHIIVPVLKGLLEMRQTEPFLLAVHIISKNMFSIEETQREEMLKTLKDFNDEQVNFFLYAHIG